MSRFMREISGELGEWWKEHAQKEVQRLLRDDLDNLEIEEDGAAKWKSNGSYLMSDTVEQFLYGGIQISAEATARKREEELKEFVKNYRPSVPTEEEMYEMRAAFGAGAVVVDVISGQRIQL